MSLAVYEVCKSFAYAEIYYQPIDKSLQKIYPDYYQKLDNGKGKENKT